MSDATQSGKPGRIESRITTGNLLTILGTVVTVAMAWQALRGDINALAQRVDSGDKRDEKTIDTLDAVKGSIIRIETEQQAVRREAERLGKQLDRIEFLIRNGGMPPAPPKP